MSINECPMSSMKETVRGHALDVIVIATDDGECFGSSEFHVIFDTIVRDNINDDNRLFVELHVNQQPLSPSTVLMKPPATYNTPWTFTYEDSNSSTKLHCDTWKQLVQDGILQYGRNHIRFLLFRRTHRCNGENEDSTVPILIGTTDACIFLWTTSDRFVVTDIDGTITKSNIVGVWDSILTSRYRHIHPGTCRFFSHILSNNTQNPNTQLRILYLSSRPSFLIDSTRRFINTLQQEQQQDSLHHNNPDKNAVHGLPDGPIILQPKSLWSAIAGEIIHKNSFLFKIHALQRYIIQPWYDADAVAKKDHVRQDHHPHASFLFAAAFGNTTCDYMAYRQVGIGQSNIFIIDEKSVIQSWREEQVEEENTATIKSTITVEQDDDNSNGVFQACMGKMLFRSRGVQSKYYIPIAEYQGGYTDPVLHQVILQNNSFRPA